MKRRDFLITTSASIGATLFAGGATNLALGALSSKAPLITDLKLQKASFLLRDQPTKNMVSLSKNAPPPVIYGIQDQPMQLNVINGLDEYTAMHWHGLRIPNKMDGVPYLTQLPIGGGETFTYEFTPPDAGTYWYHPHCMTMTQMASGLTGVMVIKEKTDIGFNSEQVINLKDFRLDKSDQLKQPYTLRGAARAGTFGNVQTANWLQSPIYNHQAGSLVRLRIANTDTTRIYSLYLTGADGEIIAWDGHPTDEQVSMPTEQSPLFLGPGQRVDIACKMPAIEGKSINLIAKVRANKKIMATLQSVGEDQKRNIKELKPLPKNPLLKPDLKSAQTHKLIFGWSPEGTVPNNGFCGSLGSNFWSINRKAWPGDDAGNIQPLVTMKQGQTHILRLQNESPNIHPIHIHGLVFKPIRSNKRKLPSNWTDTLLLLKNEIVDVVLVADNPGDWAFHCHVIEHQKTGLTGYIRVV